MVLSFKIIQGVTRSDQILAVNASIGSRQRTASPRPQRFRFKQRDSSMARWCSFPSIWRPTQTASTQMQRSREHFTNCTDGDKFTIGYNCVQYHLNSYTIQLQPFEPVFRRIYIYVDIIFGLLVKYNIVAIIRSWHFWKI